MSNRKDDHVLHAVACAVFTVVALVAAPALAAEPSAGTHPCALVEAPEQRLACFDEAFPRPAAEISRAAESQAAPNEAATSPTAVSKASRRAAAPAETVEDFGLSETERRARAPERVRDSLDRIEAKVVGVRHFSTGERVITLDNGQVWLQTEATVRGPLAEGDRVVIRKGAFSSFQLVTPGQVALRVRRVE